MIEIKWEEPPAAEQVGRRSEIPEFVKALEANPWKWAFLRGGYQQRNATQNWQRRFPNIEWVMRKMDDGKYGVWARCTENA